jgi:TolC family type I secretion outer membrane protein
MRMDSYTIAQRKLQGPLCYTKKMKQYARWIGVSLTLFHLLLSASILKAEGRLSLRNCIDTALKSQPAIRAAQENVHASQGRETQAASPYFPQVNASTGYSESRSSGGAFGNSITKSYATTLSMNQLLYDFGKTGNSYDAARWGTRSSEQDAGRVNQEVVLRVKQAYYSLLQAKKLVEVARKTIEQTESHLKQAQAFFRAGSKPRFDVTRAEVEVNNANLGLINTRNAVRIRTIALNTAMGIDPGQTTEIEETLPSVPVIPTVEQAQADALKARPEMMKAEADIEAAKARVRMEQANYFPTLSASGAYNWATGTTDMGQINMGPQGIIPLKGDILNSWNAGIMLTVPLFQGGLTRGRVSEAQANLIVLESQRDSTKQSILLEVNQAYADLESAAARVEVMESTIKKARENLDLAQGRYEAGIGPYIEVTDAQLSAVNAEIDRIQAVYDYHLSVARLMKAMGRGTE